MITVKVSAGDPDNDCEMQLLATLKTIELALTQMCDVTVFKNAASQRTLMGDNLDIDDYTPFMVHLIEED